MDTGGGDALRVGFYGSVKLGPAGRQVVAKVVAHLRYVIFQMAEVAGPKHLFRAIMADSRQMRPC